MTRPIEYSEEKHLAIVAARRRGGSVKAAASAAGMHYSTLYRWIERGKSGQEPFVDLVREMDMGYHAAEGELSDALFKGALKDPKLALLVLERMNRGHWAREPTPLMSLTVNLAETSPAEMLAELVKGLPLLAQAAGIPAHEMQTIEALFSEVSDDTDLDEEDTTLRGMD